MTTKGDLTRQHILEKSMQLFSVRGYFNTSIDSMVKATGITKGGLYGHFRNKQEIWLAVYEECVRIWKNVVFKGVRELSDPLARIERVMENSLQNYLGAGVFDGGCFLLIALVELAGQSAPMSQNLLEGVKGFAELMGLWLKEADQKGLLRPGMDYQEIATFLVVSLNGAAPLYAASKDPGVWRDTLVQLRYYLKSLRKAG